MRLSFWPVGFITLVVLAIASPVLAEVTATDAPPLPTATGNSGDLQGLTAPSPQLKPGSERDLPREYEIRSNPQNPPVSEPKTGVPEWNDQGEPRSSPGGIPFLNF